MIVDTKDRYYIGETDNSNQERSAKTVNNIRLALRSLLSEKDYERLSVKEICERAHICRKTFYIYFESKEDLLRDVLDRTLSFLFISDFSRYFE